MTAKTASTTGVVPTAFRRVVISPYLMNDDS
jgi:hypothetical protein